MTSVIDREDKKGKARTLPSAEVRQARIDLATRFLDRVLLPRARAGELVKSDIVPEYRIFTRVHRKLGSDFELEHVWNVAWSRQLVNQCLGEHNQEAAVRDAEALSLILRLLDDVS